MSTASTFPSILLVEDDPTSRVFFKAALKPLPVEVESTDRVGTAFDLALGGRHVLWLFDARLPDGSGPDLLARLRTRGLTTPAIAHTASISTRDQERLRAAGFDDVLVKPVPQARLQAVVQQYLDMRSRPPVPARVHDSGAIEHTLQVWDDVSADRALNGNHQHVLGLRRMFLADLDRARNGIVSQWNSDRPAASAELHKLRASCGFVGAARLGDAVEALQHMPDLPQSLERFDRAVTETLANPPGAPTEGLS